MRSFSPAVAERIGWYVYALVDPRDDSVFYIGKGTGNRVFAHAAAAADLAAEPTAKLDRIRAVNDAGREVECFIIRHGIESERLAYEIEAAVIDTLRLLDPDLNTDRFQLTNAVLGHRHALKGLAHASQVASLYDAPPAPPFDEAVLLLKIPGLWTPRMSARDLYEASRGWWKIGADRRAAARYACAVNKGVIRAVYRIDSWRPRRQGDREWQEDVGKPPRWGFDGTPAPEMDRYVDTSVVHLFKRGEANPVKLVLPTSTADSSSDWPPGAPPHPHVTERVARPASTDPGPSADCGSSVEDDRDELVATVAAALVRMSDWFRIEAHTALRPEGCYVQVRLDEPDRGAESGLLFEATGPAYLDAPPLTAAQLERMRELGWHGPPPMLPATDNFSRYVDGDSIAPGPLAEFVVTTLREVYGATDTDEYTLSPAALAAEVLPDPDRLDLFVPTETAGTGTESDQAEPAPHTQVRTATSSADPANGDGRADADPCRLLEVAWGVAAGRRPEHELPRPGVPFPRGLPRTSHISEPQEVSRGAAHWGAVTHLLMFGCGWWRPGADLSHHLLELLYLPAGQQWIPHKVLPYWYEREDLLDFAGWAVVRGDALFENAIPTDLHDAYGEDSRPGIADQPAHSFDTSLLFQYEELWGGQPSDPLHLADRCHAPWREPLNPHWRDYPLPGPEPATEFLGEQPTPQLLLAVDTYDGWYLELCRRGLEEADPVLVSVWIRALGTLGTFHIGGGTRPHLVVYP
jgi:hypothetical protein